MAPDHEFRLFPFVRRWWPALLGVGTAMGLLNFTYFWLGDLVRAVPTSPWPTLVEELTASYGAVILIPGVIWAALKWPLDRVGWPGRLPAGVLAVLAYSALHTTWNAITRSALFPLFGWGAYDYGAMPLRYFMELPSDVVTCAIVIPATYLVNRWRGARERELAFSRLEARLAEARLSALRAQLQPHFLFNTLNAISSVMYDDPSAADTMMARLSDLIRQTMGADGGSTVALADELAMLDDYMALMGVRFGDRLTFEVDVPQTLRDREVPTLVLQPLVENALRYGTPEPPTPAKVRIGADMDGARLRLSVTDNGPGFNGDTPEGTGVGLANTRARLEELYGDEAALRLESPAGGGARVVIEIPGLQ